MRKIIGIVLDLIARRAKRKRAKVLLEQRKKHLRAIAILDDLE